MAEWRMPQVMGQSNGFDQVLIEPQGASNGAANLRHLQRVGQAGAKQITLVIEENLGLVDQPPKGGAVDDAIAIALKLPGRWRTQPCSRRPARLRLKAVGNRHQ